MINLGGPHLLSKLKLASQFSKRYLITNGCPREQWSRCLFVFLFLWLKSIYFIGYCWRHSSLSYLVENWRVVSWVNFFARVFIMLYSNTYQISALLRYMRKVLSRSASGRYLPDSGLWVWFCSRRPMWQMWKASESDRVEESQVQGSKIPSLNFGSMFS